MQGPTRTSGFFFFAVSRFAVKILHTVAGLFGLVSLVLSCLSRSVAGLGGCQKGKGEGDNLYVRKE